MSSDGRPTAHAATLDLRGVPCPLNWARAKARLEGMTPGESLQVLVDDPRAKRDFPAAAETEGWAVTDTARAGGGWAIVIER